MEIVGMMDCIESNYMPPMCRTALKNGYLRKDQNFHIMEEETCEECGNWRQERPPRNVAVMHHCISHTDASESLIPGENSEFVPIFRSGCCSEKGPKAYMEDEYICVDNLCEHFGAAPNYPSPGAFYGVFDGHGGVDAASFTRKNILQFILEDLHFSAGVKRAVRNAFIKADHALADAKSLDRSSGTTALTALMLGRNMIIANAGDSRAVLGKRGRAIELSKDHKPDCTSDRIRIEKLGGVI